MGWKDKMKEFGGGDLTFLSSDGEVLVCVVVDDPVRLKGTYRKKEQERIGCPVVTDEGFVLFITGKRVARKISKFEAVFKDKAIMIVRHGDVGDMNCTYDVSASDNAERAQRLFEIAKEGYNKDLLKQAILDAEDCMNQ